MSANVRFHSKWHSKIHHTDPTTGYIDSARDPIASPTNPYMGNFIISGGSVGIGESSISSTFGLKVAGSISARDDLYVGGKAYLSAGDSGVIYLGDQSTDTHVFRGKVGVGTGAPGDELTIAGDISGRGSIILGRSEYVNFNTTKGTGGYGLRDNAGTIQFKHDGSAWSDFTSSSSAGGWADDGTVVRLDTSTDKVGIGTLSPYETLTVTGNISASGGISAGVGFVYDHIKNRVGIGTANPTETLTVAGNISASGGISAGSGTFVYDDITERVGIGTYAPLGMLHIQHDTNTGMTSANHIFGMNTGGISISAVPIAKAWLSYDGSGYAGGGGQGIVGSYNISSVTDVGTGRYKVYYVTNLNTTEVGTHGGASVVVTAEGNLSTSSESTQVIASYNNYCEILVAYDGGSGSTYTLQDADYLGVVVLSN